MAFSMIVLITSLTPRVAFSSAATPAQAAPTNIATAMVTTIRSGLLVLQVGNFWLQLFLGVILLLAVMLDRYRGLYAERRQLGRR
jgi:ribose/xylose/arabinose/galactoside ABC-type transport system permease subunit